MRLINYLNIRHLLLHYRRHRLQKQFGKGLHVGLNSSLCNTAVGYNVYINHDVSIKDCLIGDHSYINSGCRLTNVTIKKFTSVGSNVVMGLGKHPTNMASTHPAFYSNNKGFPTFADKMYFDEIGDTIVIGNDVWIGYGAIIMSGVSIGDGSIVAAGAIVTKNVIPYSIVGGVPARLLKMRFDEETIEKMLKISWWDYSLEDIAMNFACFHDVKKFIRAFSPNATHTGSKC